MNPDSIEPVATDSKAAPDLSARRPIKARQSRWAPRMAASLANAGVTPNAISLGSIGFGAVAGFAFVASLWWPGPIPFALWMLLAILGIQARLICNLLDGLVAVEGGKGSKSGEIYNDLPDRIADPLILVAAGYAAAGPYGATLGWLAALLAVLTAYVRVLGRSIGAGIHFAGPMAKQHRMAVLTGACIFAAVANIWRYGQAVLLAALVIIILGSIITVIRRLKLIKLDLESR